MTTLTGTSLVAVALSRLLVTLVGASSRGLVLAALLAPLVLVLLLTLMTLGVQRSFDVDVVHGVHDDGRRWKGRRWKKVEEG